MNVGALLEIGVVCYQREITGNKVNSCTNEDKRILIISLTAEEFKFYCEKLTKRTEEKFL